MKSVLEYLESSTLKNPNQIAVIEKEKQITYIELLNYAKQIGSYLTLSINQPVIIYMNKSIEVLASFFGTIYAGGFYILVNPDLPIERQTSIIEQIDTHIILTSSSYYQQAIDSFSYHKVIDVSQLHHIDIDEKKLLSIEHQKISLDPLYGIFTSGSTGKPKGVIISHQSVIDFIDDFVTTFDIGKNDRIANQAPFDFDVSVKDIYSTIATGATMIILEKELFSKPMELLDRLVENKATTLIWAVSAICLVTTFHGLDYKVPTTINKVLFSGEVMPIKHLNEWMKHLPDALFVNLYGPTEITCNCLYHVVDKNRQYEMLPLGIPFKNKEVYLLKDGQFNEQEGEIVVRGSGLSLGYYANQEQTNRHFIQNPAHHKYRDLIYITGDLAKVINGELYFAGRKDFQIKYLGHRIELEEIEGQINAIDGVDRCALVFIEEKSKLHCFFSGSITKKDILITLRKKLPVYMIPNAFHQIESFPLSKNGKIDRKKLKEML